MDIKMFRIREKAFQIGETVWISSDNIHDYPAIVVAVFDVGSFDYPYRHYIVQVPTHIEDYLDFRPEFAMYDHERFPVANARAHGAYFSKVDARRIKREKKNNT